MISPTNDQLLTRLRADDHSAMQLIFKQHYTDACMVVYKYVKDQNTAKDIAQEVFIKFWQKRNSINIQSSMKAYIRRMSVNEAISHLRRQKYFDEISTIEDQESSQHSEQQFLHKELEDNISLAIDTLPPRCKIIFQLSRFEELTYKEIAARLEISVKTVENQMGKALKIMRASLKQYLS